MSLGAGIAIGCAWLFAAVAANSKYVTGLGMGLALSAVLAATFVIAALGQGW